MSLHWAYNPLGIGGLAPYPGDRGVFISSGGDLKYSAMVVSNGTIGLGQLGDYMKVYSRGSALNYTVSSGAVQVFPGGLVSSFTHLGGSTYVYNSGLITDTLINVPTGVANNGFFVSNGGSAVNTTIIRGGITATGSAVILSTTLLSGYLFVSSGSYASAVVVGGYQNPGGYIAIREGGIAEDIVLSSGGSALVYTDAIGSNITVSSAGYLLVRVGSGFVYNATVLLGGAITMSGGTLTSAVAVSGGTVYISSGGSANDVDFAGGSGRVYAGGTLTNVTVSSGAMLAVTGEGAYISGGTAYGRLDSTADAVTVSTRIYVQSGGLIEDLVLDGTTAANTGWAKAVLYVLDGGIASNIHAKGSSYYGGSISVSRGGSAIDCEMNRYGFYIYTGGTAIRPVVSQTTGLAQLYAYGGATVYDLRNLRGTTSAHHNSYISGGVVSGGSLLEWGSATGITISAYKSGTNSLRGSLEVRHGNTVSASSAHVGTATNIINKSVVWIYGGTMHTMMMQPDLEATNLGATATVRNHVNNAVVAEDRVGYLTDVTVSGAPTAGGVRSWLYISSGGVVSGATMHASGCIVVYSGGRIEDLHISNNCAGYAFSMTSGASANNVYRVGSHGSNGTGMAVALIDRGAEVTNLHNSGGGATYAILNRGHISGYYAYTVLNGGTVERTYLYNQHLSGYLEDVHLYGLGSSGSIENLIYIASSSYAQNIHAESGFNTVWVIQSAFAQNLYASGGALVVNTSSGCSAVHMSGAIAGVMNGVASDVVIDQPFPPGAPSRSFYVYPTGSADGITRYTPNDVASTWSLVYIFGGTATNVATYGGNGANINLRIYGAGHVSGLTMANYNGGSPYSEVHGGFVYDFTQSGGWFYVKASGTEPSALIQNGYVTGMSEGLQKNGVIRVSSGAVASNISALALANTDYYGVVYVSSAGLTKDTYQIGGYWDVSAGGATSNHVLSGGGRLSATGINARPAYFRVSSGGVAYNVSALGSGRDSDNQVNRAWIYVLSGGYLSGAYISEYGSALANKGGTITELIDRSQADIYGSLGVASNYAYINLGAAGITGAHADYIVQYGGRTRLNGGATGDATLDEVYLSGGTVWVWQNGTLSSGIIDRGTSSIAVMMVSSGGVAYNITVKGGELQLQNPSLVSNIVAINSGIVHVSSGGVASTAVISSGGSCIVSSGGRLYDVTVASSGTLQILEGADTVSGITVLPADPTTFVSLDAAKMASIYSPFIISGAQVHLACTVDDMEVYSAGVVVASDGCDIMGVLLSGANTAMHISSGALAEFLFLYDSAMVHVSNGGSARDASIEGGADTAATSTQIRVYSGGQLDGCSIASGGQVIIYAGGLGDYVSAVTPDITHKAAIAVSAGGRLESAYCAGLSGRIWIYSSGYGSDIRAENACEVWVYGSADNVLASGCTYVAQNHGIISSATAINGLPVKNQAGALLARSGTIINARCSSGGNVHVSAGGLASNTSVLSSGRLFVSSAGTAVVATAGSSAIIYAYNGGVVSSARCSNGGQVIVSSGGTAAVTILSSGGLLQVSSGGSATGAVASAGGGVRVYSTAILTNTEIMYNDGAIYRGSVKVHAGGYASGVNVHGELFAYSNGIMEDIYNTASNHIGICATFVQGGTCTNYHAEYAGNLRVGYLGSGGICSSASLLGAPTIKQYIYVSNGASIYDVDIASAEPLSKGIMIESAGAAYNISVSSGAYCYVSAGGTAEQVTATGGTVTVFSEGMLTNIEIVSNGLLTANDGAEVSDIVASDAVDLTKTSIQLSPLAMVYGTITVNHARAHLAGTIETLSALDSAIVVASSGCNMMSAYLEGYGTELHVQGGAVVDTIGMEQGSAYISSGGIISATDANNVYGTATISSGGLLHIGANAYFEYFVVLSGGTVYVNDTAEIDDYESEPGAVIIWGD